VIAEPELNILSLMTSVGVITSHTSFDNDDNVEIFSEKEQSNSWSHCHCHCQSNDTLRRCGLIRISSTARMRVTSGHDKLRSPATAGRLLAFDSELDELARLSDIVNFGAGIVSILSTSVGVIISHTSLDDDNDKRLLQERAIVFLTPALLSFTSLNVTLRCLVVRSSLTAGRLLEILSGNEARRCEE
jgi:hypothetical protein